MRWRTVIVVACMGSSSIFIPFGLLNGGVSIPSRDSKISLLGLSWQAAGLSLISEQLPKQAQSITVRILSREVIGAGFLANRQGTVYTVLTNAHVLRSGTPPYHIQTSDGHVYLANLFQSVSFKGNDLALLQFRSFKVVYKVASFGDPAIVGEEVFAAGFPLSVESSTRPISPSITDYNTGFVFTSGKVTQILSKPLKGGYQIGYTNVIEKGMSGGPLFNHRGEVIAINGMHAEPLWDIPYEFTDNSEATPDQHKKMSQYSWGIPIETFKQLGLPALRTHKQ
ncbi:peptidase S1 and S6, chymotrypsin/Hap [Microcystis aeruginosa NIES-98]|nr:peptidase S1 and S6, chymotrypsin/Hap [Microcystis aeruginosa NIES-98]